ncbi:MAG: tRNA glutamyl-Q(34) synthetase GluQRS [Pseudomonadota bacterium]
MPPSLVTRFAPSPTGLLHLGHAYSALLNHDLAQAHGGDFRLRIEDIDQTRCQPGFEAAIREDLLWLGMEGVGPVFRQSERLGVYQDAIDKLAARGLVYRCFKTRSELQEAMRAPHGGTVSQSALHSATAPLPTDEEDMMMAEGRPFAWRLNARRALETIGPKPLTWREFNGAGADHQHPIDPSSLGDEVLARKDVPTSYHLASVIDDAAQDVSLVWRGEDLRSAIPIHRVLQELLGLPQPLYRHHALVTDEQGRRLAKRDKAETLRALRESGATPQDIRQRLGLPPADERAESAGSAQSPKGV